MVVGGDAAWGFGHFDAVEVDQPGGGEALKDELGHHFGGRISTREFGEFIQVGVFEMHDNAAQGFLDVLEVGHHVEAVQLAAAKIHADSPMVRVRSLKRSVGEADVMRGSESGFHGDREHSCLFVERGGGVNRGGAVGWRRSVQVL